MLGPACRASIFSHRGPLPTVTALRQFSGDEACGATSAARFPRMAGFPDTLTLQVSEAVGTSRRCIRSDEIRRMGRVETFLGLRLSIFIKELKSIPRTLYDQCIPHMPCFRAHDVLTGIHQRPGGLPRPRRYPTFICSLFAPETAPGAGRNMCNQGGIVTLHKSKRAT